MSTEPTRHRECQEGNPKSTPLDPRHTRPNRSDWRVPLQIEGSVPLLPLGRLRQAVGETPLQGRDIVRLESRAVVMDTDTQVAGTTLSCIMFQVPQAQAPRPLFSLASPHCVENAPYTPQCSGRKQEQATWPEPRVCHSSPTLRAYC